MDDLLELIFGTDIGGSGDGGLFDIIQELLGFGDDGDPSSINTDLLGTLLGLAASQNSFFQPTVDPTGYQGGIPDYTAVRQRAPLATGIEYTDRAGQPYVAPTGSGLGALGGENMPQGIVAGGPSPDELRDQLGYGTSTSPYTPTGRVLPLGYDPNRRPGSGGRRYFTDTQYVPTGRDLGEDGDVDQGALTQARAQADQQGLNLLLGNLSNLAREQRSGDPTTIVPTQAGPMPTDNYVSPQPEPEPEPRDPGFFPPPGDGTGPNAVVDKDDDITTVVLDEDDNDPFSLGDDNIGTPIDDEGNPLGTGTGGPAPEIADDSGYTGPEPEPEIADDGGYTGPEPEPEIADDSGYTGPIKGDPTKQPPLQYDDEQPPEMPPEEPEVPDVESRGNGIVDAAPRYWMVGGERFENRDAAIASARALGDPGGIELFNADGSLVSGRPQYTPEEREAEQERIEQARIEAEARRERNQRRNEYWGGLIGEYSADDYQQNVNQDDYYTINSPRLGELKFASFQDAKSFLEKFNTGGDESITDVYDRSQRSSMPTSFGNIKSSGGDKTRYQFGNTQDRYGQTFEDRDKAADYLMNQEMSKNTARFNREINFKPQGGGFYEEGQSGYTSLNDYDLSTEEGYNKLKRRVGPQKAEYLSGLVNPESMRAKVNQRLEDKDSGATGIGAGMRTQQFARGGIAGLKQGKYLNGSTDGMADQIPASIDGEQPAALSDGEFVIPADVVSHLGNGNSDAGAKALEEMMTRARKQRTGNGKQGKQINPRAVLPS